ncbi:uncharacterized protein LOC142324527 [Lycorma delicatula]|uniref:uncharacterized protein LOC142324527 n=1 Tax=Lycorma delicatula TaxID=130591 RepID=UPI003F5103BB
MGSEQQFCLRWHNYQSSLLATLPLLLDGDDLTDVTLCAGGRSLKAHRVVLSACSQYFKDLFKEMQPMQHPVIVLPGTEFTDLCALVTFMYSGEVNIYQHQLTSLLAMADTLHIRGLAEFTGYTGFVNNSESVRKETSTSPRSKRAKVTAPTLTSSDDLLYHAMTSRTKPKNVKPKADNSSSESFPCWDNITTQNTAEDLSQRVPSSGSGSALDDTINLTNSNNNNNNNNNDNVNVPSIKQESDQQESTGSSSGGTVTNTADHNTSSSALPTDLTQSNNSESGSKNTTNRSERGERGSGQNVSNSKLYAMCFVCGKMLSNQYNLRVHMETHLNAHYACSACNHVSRSRDALRKHVSYRHPQTSTETPSRSTKQLHP